MITMFLYFSIAQANEILPIVIKKFEFVNTKKKELAKIEQQLQISLSTFNNFEEYINLKQQLNAAITKFYQAVEDLENTGIVVKSIDLGLLDFPSKRFNEEVWLCWKYGENEIRFWHERDSGFQGRKPISVSNESLV